MIRSQPAAPVRAVYVGGPRDGRETTFEVPGGISTIVNVDDPLGVYVRASFLPDGGWRLAADLLRVRRRRGMSGSGDRRIVPGSAPDATISHRQALVGRASGAAFSVDSPARQQCRNAPRFSWRNDKGGPIRMAVLVTFSMKTDVATYEAMHAMMTAPGVPQPPGLIVHTAHEVNGTIAMVEVWDSAEDQHRFMSDPRMAEDLAARGVPIPDDLTVTPLILAYQP